MLDKQWMLYSILMALSNLDMDGNTRAIKLYESEGFIKESVLRENTKTEQGFRSQRIYAML
jgi:hypothetical protein